MMCMVLAKYIIYMYSIPYFYFCTCNENIWLTK